MHAYGGGGMIFQFSIVQIHFVFSLNFIVLLPYLIKYYNTMFVIIVFRLGSVQCLHWLKLH